MPLHTLLVKQHLRFVKHFRPCAGDLLPGVLAYNCPGREFDLGFWPQGIFSMHELIAELH